MRCFYTSLIRNCASEPLCLRFVEGSKGQNVELSKRQTIEGGEAEGTRTTILQMLIVIYNHCYQQLVQHLCSVYGFRYPYRHFQHPSCKVAC